MAEMSGTVSFGKDTKGKNRFIITNDDGEVQWRVDSKNGVKSTCLRVNVLSVVRWLPMVHKTHNDIFYAKKGETELANYIVNEVQDVYRC